MQLKPLNDRVVVKRIEEEEKTAGGIIIPDTAKEKPIQGEVKAVGSGKVMKDGSRRPLDVKAGDRVSVVLEADEAPRTVKPPADLARALKANPAAKARWEELSFTHRKEYVAAIEEAKKPETRARRLAKAIEQLAGQYHTRSKQP